MKQAVELTRLTPAQREEVFRELARSGLYPAREGDRIHGPGMTTWQISNSPNQTVLVDGRAVATTGAKANVDKDAHGCPACPHPPPIVLSGLPDVLINGRPVAIAGSETSHTGCRNPGSGWVMEGRGELAGTKRQINQTQALGMRARLVRGA